MFRHIAHSRLILMEGLWNAEVDRYEPTTDDSFTLVLRRDRLYAMDKATPLHLGGSKDESANARKLINDRVSRGTKILRCAKNIQGVFMHVTVRPLAYRDMQSKLFILTTPHTQNEKGPKTRVRRSRRVRYGEGGGLMVCCDGAAGVRGHVCGGGGGFHAGQRPAQGRHAAHARGGGATQEEAIQGDCSVCSMHEAQGDCI